MRAPTHLRAPLRTTAPAAFVAVNAVAFWIVRPGVPDLWAARARASAAGHGVGLTYWFSWFGGSTPGNYSVVTPWLSALIGTETVAAVAAVVLMALVTELVRDVARPALAAWLAAFGVLTNLWCGRVPFLLGCALGVAALLAVRHRSRIGAALLAFAAVLASPVAGAFLCLGLSGVLIGKRVRAYRTPALLAVGGAGSALITLGVLFGMPGPEPFPPYLIGEILLALLLLFAAKPPRYLRITLLVCAAGTLVLFAVPNGLGANLVRLAVFCLPPAVVALTRYRLRLIAALAAPILAIGVMSSESAIVSATKPASTAAFYAPLARELDSLPSSANYRLELVGTGHAAYAALLGHAVLARGWETQEDLAHNARLDKRTLDAATYRVWLDDNAVGYIALDLPGGAGAEANLVTTHRPGYLQPVWHTAQWVLFRVHAAQPIVAAPAVLTQSSQSALTVHVPCACKAELRVRWSKFLVADAQLPDDTPDRIVDAYGAVLAPTADGWTTLTTAHAGDYTVSGVF